MIHIIGEILVDIFQTNQQQEVFPGGAPFNVACNIDNFGGDVSFYGSVGKDENGTLLIKEAKKHHFKKLIINKPKNKHTSEAIVTLDNGERSFRFNRANGADYIFSKSKLEKLDIKKGDIVHIGSLMLSEPRGKRFFNNVIQYVKDKGALLSFDINYRDDIFPNEKYAKRLFKKVIPNFDILKFSDDELYTLTNKKKLSKCLEKLLTDNQTAFVSLGKNGSLVYKKEVLVTVPTVEVKPIDTTGAGDAFYSYVLYCLDKGEKDYKEILYKANAVGAIATLKKGAINVAPNLTELDNYLSSIK